MLSDSEAESIVEGLEKMYAPVEVAYIVSKKTATIRNHCRDGRINATKSGNSWLISKSEVARYIKDGPLPEKEES